MLREAGPLADAVERGGGSRRPAVALLRIGRAGAPTSTPHFGRARALPGAGDPTGRAAGAPGSLCWPWSTSPTPNWPSATGGAARTALARAREVVDEEPVSPFVVRCLEEAETADRAGRGAATAARSGVLAEELTDRELSILRALPGSATQREIGAALFLSINTVKAYNKSLYRKLGVASRQDAVTAARRLGLI